MAQDILISDTNKKNQKNSEKEQSKKSYGGISSNVTSYTRSTAGGFSNVKY